MFGQPKTREEIGKETGKNVKGAHEYTRINEEKKEK